MKQFKKSIFTIAVLTIVNICWLPGIETILQSKCRTLKRVKCKGSQDIRYLIQDYQSIAVGVIRTVLANWRIVVNLTRNKIQTAVTNITHGLHMV